MINNYYDFVKQQIETRKIIIEERKIITSWELDKI